MRQNAGALAPSLRVLCVSRREHFYQMLLHRGIEPATEVGIFYLPPIEAEVLGAFDEKYVYRHI